MTKVEKLREEILISSVDDILNMLDAAHAEGKAEGAEQERKANIWRAERCSFQCTFGTCPLVPKIGQKIVPSSASVLAPKEKP